MNKNVKQSLLAEFGSWLTFVDQISSIIWDKKLGEGKWSVRDVVSHIFLWDKYFYEKAIKPISENKPLIVKNLDFEPFNQNAREFAKTKTNLELAELSKDIRKQILKSIHEQPEENFTKEYKDVEGQPFIVQSYLTDFICHDQHHMMQIKQMNQE